MPRRRRLEIDERVLADGSVSKSVDRLEVEAAVTQLLADGVTALAICFFNSFVNASNERAAAEIVRELVPDLPLSLSCEVDPRIREYERVSTTVMNSYAMPRLQKYMHRLQGALPSNVPINYMQSGGGVVPGSLAANFPIHLLYSGPAAGVLASQAIAREQDLDAVCTMDMGGTSCDVCLIQDGAPSIKDLVEPEWGIPIRTPTLDIRAIGAGGGSVAWIDSGGALRVGPQSTGSDPGPASYGRGGVQPTVTDANLILGILNPTGLLGGRMPLDVQAAQTAFEPLARALELSIEQTALGVFRIVNANMAQAVRELTVRVGVDPRYFTLLPFGGAGGQHAASVASEVGMQRIVFPRNASAFSAYGLLQADLQYTSAVTLMRPIDDIPPERLKAVFSELESTAWASLGTEQLRDAPTSANYWADVRYIGQSHEIAVPVSLNGEVDVDRIETDFRALHERLYGVWSDNPAEVVDLRTTVTGEVRSVHMPHFEPTTVDAAPNAFRQTAFAPEPLPVFWRDSLPPGWRSDSACLVEEVDSVILVTGGAFEVDKYGNLVLEFAR